MSINVSIKKATPFPKKICSHATFAWKDTILVWGGKNFETHEEYETSVVFMYHSREWIRKQTSGVAPERCSGASHVINDTMYVIDSQMIFALDLNAWTWSRFHAIGINSIINYWFIRVPSWAHNDKIYMLGNDDNKLCCYNVKHNSLEWVNQEGEFPRGYLGVKPILHGDTVIVFGVGGMGT